MAPATQSPFLDVLPPELRLNIYSHLLVASTPLKGQLARQGKTYDLHTAILRTNRQIHHEARSVFFGKNTFYITSIPPTASPAHERRAGDEAGQDQDEGSGAFEPPLQLRDLPLVRHLEIDLLYYPKTMLTVQDPRTGIWKPVCVGAQRYSTSLSYLLSAVETRLLSLKLCADARRYMDDASGSSNSNNSNSNNNNDDDDDSTPKDSDGRLETQRLLTGFYMADASPLFRKALARLHVADMALHFDFPESYFDFVVRKKVLCRQNLVELAGQVLSARSHIRLRAARHDSAGGGGGGGDGGDDHGHGDGDDDDDDFEFATHGAVTLIPGFSSI